MRRHARWAWHAVFLACVIAAGWRSTAIGKDANWDLKNYHWYNPWALLNGRMGWDLAPAQIQTYYNPVADLPFHFLVNVLPWPRHVAFWMSLPAAIALFFLVRILVLLLPPAREPQNLAWIAIAVAIGATGASGQATLGSTMNEWLCAAFVMGGLWLAVRAAVEGEVAHPRGFTAAAFLFGCAVGLKLTYVIFAAGFALALVAFGPWRMRARRIVVAGVAMAAGFALFGGYWAWTMWREFGNPTFPYYNHLFHSPWWEDRAFFDTNWGPRTLAQWLFFPFSILDNYLLTSEVPIHDGRLAALMAVTLLALAKALVVRPRIPPQWLLLAVFTLGTYLVWLKLFGIYRYLVPLEALSGALMVGCVTYLVRGVAWRLLGAGTLAVLVIGTTVLPDWGRIPFGRAYFENQAPRLPPGSLVIIGYVHPYAYEIPFFQPDARFVSPANNFLMPGQGNLLARRIEEVIRTHPGPIYLLEMKSRLRQDDATVAYFGLGYAPGPCLGLRTPMADNYEQVCPLRRLSPA